MLAASSATSAAAWCAPLASRSGIRVRFSPARIAARIGGGVRGRARRNLLTLPHAGEILS